MKSLSLLLGVLSFCTLNLLAEDKAEPAPAPQPKTYEQQLVEAGIEIVKGPAKVTLGKQAEMNLPEGFAFIPEGSMKKFQNANQNGYRGNEVGAILAQNWTMIFRYEDVGYVKDDEKDKLDADALMKSMSEGQDEANADRKAKGWDELKLAGWATKPYYDQKTNNLKWAFLITSSSDNHKTPFINESIRLLGRGGYMNVVLVTDNEAFKASEAEADKLLAESFSYAKGEKYAEFKPGDKVAQYGLAALVLGGGAAAAAKMGLFAKLGGLFAKMGKAVILVIVAIGAAIKKAFDWITGSRPKDDASS